MPRLRTSVAPKDASPIATSNFVVDRLEPGSDAPPDSVRGRDKNGIHLLDLRAGARWQRPIDHRTQSAVFVSLLLYASANTTVQVGDAQIRFAPSPIRGHLQVEVLQDDPRTRKAAYRPVGIHAPLDAYDGHQLAAVPVLTIRLDEYDGEWDLFSGMSLIAAGIPYPANSRRSAAEVVIRAGDDVALVGGLVQSSENPLYEDANGNGIDDRFEEQKQRGILQLHAPLGVRIALADDWRAAMRAGPPSAMLVERIVPDQMNLNGADAGKGGRP